MLDWYRRSIIATGAALSTAGVLTSISSVAADEYGEDAEDDSEGGDGGSNPERPTGVAWRYDGPYDIDSTVATDGRVYTQAQESVYALDAEDGSQVWETGDIGAEGTPSVDGDTLYVAGDPIQAINTETGEVRWESEISSQDIAVGHGMVYTSSDYTVYALDADDGSIRWERESVTVETDDGEETAEELQMGDVSEKAVYAFDSAFAAGRGGMFAGLDPMTGETEVTVDHDESVTHVTAGSGHVAIFPAYDATYLFDMSSQETVGSTSITLTHTIIGDAYFTVGRNGNLSAFNLSDSGTHAWALESALGLPELVGDTAIAAYGPDTADLPEGEDGEDRVMAFEFETGEEAWRYTFDEREWTGTRTSIAADDDTVYVSRDGELLALRAENEEEESGDDSSPDDGDDEVSSPDDSDSDNGNAGDDNSSDENGDSNGNDENGDTGDDGSNGEADDTGSDDDAGESDDDAGESDEDDGMPGFTTGAGIVGGAATLEWLRRRAGVDESTGDEPAE